MSSYEFGRILMYFQGFVTGMHLFEEVELVTALKVSLRVMHIRFTLI